MKERMQKTLSQVNGVKNYAAIVRISSEPVEISSEPVEISSELVEISSELVLRISELLIISVFRKMLNSVSHTLIPPCHADKGELLNFTFIYLFVKSVQRTISSELLRPLPVISSSTLRNRRKRMSQHAVGI